MTYKQLLKAGHVFDASGVTNPFVFQWEERNGIYYPVDFKLLSVSIYKFPLGDCTNGGVSGGDAKDVYIPHPEGPYKALSPHTDQRLILIPEHRGKNYWALKDVYERPKMIGPMAGGNLAYSSDSRCEHVYHIHDRFETQEDYDLLSR
ncbi:MAG TPA: hypothetical protein PKI55_06350 [Chitinophagaceae bacterium]|nr:hypothetical protein [Chitinophagaceae bacterium]